jgi:glyoxylase-like metal-dependent hydrolase (beta-lactamase superfamily II)
MEPKHFVTVHALNAGHLTLPEKFFVSPLEDDEARKTVPSLSFLINHTDVDTGKVRRIVFDLGIRRKPEEYPEPLYKHSQTRQPLSGQPDTVSSLAKGGLSPDDVDIVMFSHLHWDHIGMPSDYPRSTYVIGPGALKLIDGSTRPGIGSHNFFETGMLDFARTVELPPVEGSASARLANNKPAASARELSNHFNRHWSPIASFDHAMDIFGDGSVYIVSAPGHLDGHINLLCRLESGNHVYLAGDACHDERLLTGEKEVATWTDAIYPGVTCCIHKDKAMAENTIRNMREAVQNPGELQSVEIIFAHDPVWAKNAEAQGRFFPGSL